jgi:hypothetical protein
MPTKFQPRYTAKRTVVYTNIKEFYATWMPKIDLMPIEQRLDVQKVKNEKKNTGSETKRQGVIGAMFNGLDIGEICLYELTPEDISRYVELYEMDNVLPNAVHDGGHRSRAIRDFVLNKFPTHKTCGIGSKYYHELTSAEKEWFDEYELWIKVFKNASPAFRGKQFEQAGKSTSLNEQEILNGHGNIPVGNAIREISRELGSGINNTPHELFRLNPSKNGKVVAVWLSTGPDRLSYDRFVARIMYLTLHGDKPGPCDDAELTRMYENSKIDRETIEKVRKKVIDCLDFILGMAKAKITTYDRRSKMDLIEATAVMRLYFTYMKRGAFKVRKINFDAFWERFENARGNLKNGASKYAMEIIDGGHPRWLEFEKQLRQHKKIEQWNNTIVWLEGAGLDYQSLITDGIIILSLDQGSRCFDIEDVKRKWREQSKCCGITNKPLAFKDAEGGHIVSYANGGKTEYSNLIVIHKDHNRAMGTLNAVDYKKNITT